jgi:hypothetical protein
MERAEQQRSAPQPALYIFKKAGATFHLDSFLPLILSPTTFSCFGSSSRELGHLLSRRFFLYQKTRLLVFTQCRKKEWLLTKGRVTLQLDPMVLARLSRRALLLGYRDDLLLSLLVAELDTNISFLSRRTKEDFDWLAEDSQADSAPSSPLVSSRQIKGEGRCAIYKGKWGLKRCPRVMTNNHQNLPSVSVVPARNKSEGQAGFNHLFLASLYIRIILRRSWESIAIHGIWYLEK